jgi:hypothetical protein
MAEAIQWPLSRPLPDGRELHVFPLTYGRGRIGVTCPGRPGIEGYGDIW